MAVNGGCVVKGLIKDKRFGVTRGFIQESDLVLLSLNNKGGALEGRKLRAEKLIAVV